MIIEIPELDEALALLRRLVSQRQSPVARGPYVDRAEIAAELHRSVSWVRKRPWVLPPGEPDIPGRPQAWARSRWEEHRENVVLPRLRREALRISA